MNNKTDAADIQKEKKRKGRPARDPNRKGHSFYCTPDERLFLDSLLKKMRRCVEEKEGERK